MSNYPKGSEWRKWDLHVHTPDSRLNQGFADDWGTYIDALATSEFAVCGITNYFCFAEGELEKVRQGLQARRAAKTVFGNLEFRISQANKDNEFINVHVIFSERLSTQDINDAIAHLTLVNTADPRGAHPIYCCDADIRKAGLDFSKILISFQDLVDHLKSHFQRFDYLVACCPSGYGSFRPAAGDGRGNHLAIEIDKGCDLAFGNDGDRQFFLKADRYPGALLKPVIAGSETDLDLGMIMLLDKVQKRQAISADDSKRLRAAKLVEGRYPNLVVAAAVAAATGEKAKHIRDRGFNSQYYRDLIIALIGKHQPVSREDIDRLLLDKLPEVLTDEQKLSKIHNLLSSLSGKVIRNAGTRQASRWVLIKQSKQ